MLRSLFVTLFLILLLPAAERRIDNLAVAAAISGENMTCTVAFTAVLPRPERIALVGGDLVLEPGQVLPRGAELLLATEGRGYDLSLPAGTHAIALRFAVRPQVLADGAWREASFSVPASAKRELRLDGDRADLEVDFPGALRQERNVADGKLAVTAILGPGLPFIVRWKPQVAELAAELVFSTRSNAVVTVNPGSVRLDEVVVYEVAQGRLTACRMGVPDGLAITRVEGPHIRTWRVDQTPGGPQLVIELVREVGRQYAFRVEAERALGALPAETTVPCLRALGALRSHGHLLLGTDSALALAVSGAKGCTQTDLTAFRALKLAESADRPLPQGNAFAYAFPAQPWTLDLRLADVVPSYDASHFLTLQVREDDLIADWRCELEVRDAPLRDVQILLPPGLGLAEVTGTEVDADSVLVAVVDGRNRLSIPFKQPVQGRVLLHLRLEHGRTPLDGTIPVQAPVVVGARSERGALVLAADEGVRIAEAIPAESLKQVHAGTLPIKVPGAQRAWRFREGGWKLDLRAERRLTGLRAESFHLLSLGEGICYGTVVINYVITGAPIDELHFTVDPRLGGVEFIGADVVRATARDGEWTVKLRRKVIGDYNLGVSFTRAIRSGEPLPLAAVACRGFDHETGYVVLASQRSLDLAGEPRGGEQLLAITDSELPGHYRLLVTSPMLRSWKFVNRPSGPVEAQLRDHSEGLPLPALIELMDLDTQLSIRSDGAVESHTVVRYKIKNAHEQFIDLRLPPGSRAWGGVSLIAADGSRRRATVSEAEGMLKVQLDRGRNPNEPVTVELGYGQAHGGVGGGPVSLQAPQAGLGSSFVAWQVRGHEGWSLAAASAGMELAGRPRQVQDLSSVLDAVAGGWQHAVDDPVLLLSLGAALAVLLVITFWVSRRWLPVLAVSGALVLALVLGIAAVDSVPLASLARVDAIADLSATQAMDFLDTDTPALVVSITSVNGIDASLSLLLLGAVLAAGALAAAWRWPRLRLPGTAVALAALAVPLAGFALPRLVLAHLLTWGAPLLLLLVLYGRGLLRRRSLGRLALAAALLLLASACAGGGGKRPVAAQLSITEVAVNLTAETDSMAVDMELDLSGPAGAELPLLGEGVVLLTPTEPAPGVAIELREGRHLLCLKRAGSYHLSVRFLTPLAPARTDGLCQFSAPLPIALANRLTATVPAGMEIACPTAVHFIAEPGAETEPSRASAVLGIGEDATLLWKPRARDASREALRCFVELSSAYRIDTGLIEGRHGVVLRIAQGELRELVCTVPPGLTVTAVDGAGLSTWRFDPASRRLEALVTHPVRDAWELSVVTQQNLDALPIEISLGGLEFAGVEHQRSQLALAPTAAVHAEIRSGGARLGAADFARQAGSRLCTLEQMPELRAASRLLAPGDAVMVACRAVQPELRSSEEASFSLSDDRLVYNGTYVIDISKAGVFQVQLELPPGYEVDALAAPAVSHWDELVDDSGRRLLTLHFANRNLGRVEVQLGLSAVVHELPDTLHPPRIALVGSLKHRGRLVLSPEQGVRLVVRERSGVSELDPREIGLDDGRSQAYALLDPAWKLNLSTEVVAPQIHVDALHVVRVSEGLLRHEHQVRWQLKHAGAKTLELVLPRGFPAWREAGVMVRGPDLSSYREETRGESRVLVVELDKKWFDRTYPLLVAYETRHDRGAGGAAAKFAVQPLCAVGAEVQRHHLAVFASDRIELSVTSRGEGVLEGDPRAIDASFGVADLAAAAYCFRGGEDGCAVDFTALRHGAADLLTAEVQSARLATVMTRDGASMTRVLLALRVGAKRHLELRLPANATLWTAAVSGRPVLPARRSDTDPVRLLPLSQGAAQDVAMEVEFIYVVGPQTGAADRFALSGPGFDLPLRDVNWVVYAPADLRLDDFAGTLSHQEGVGGLAVWDAARYDRELVEGRHRDNQRASQYASQSQELGERGDQRGARLALEYAFNYSLGDQDLNEDARVQLHSLNRQQALVGIVGRRGSLNGSQQAEQAGQDLGEQFSTADAKRLESSLSKDDVGNLYAITNCLVASQLQAVTPSGQIRVALPEHGRIHAFTRALQVDPASPLAISFAVHDAPSSAAPVRWGLGLALAAAAALLLGLSAWGARLLPPPAAIAAAAVAVATPAPSGDLLAGIPGMPSAAQVGQQVLPPELETERELADDDEDGRPN